MTARPRWRVVSITYADKDAAHAEFDRLKPFTKKDEFITWWSPANSREWIITVASRYRDPLNALPLTSGEVVMLDPLNLLILEGTIERRFHARGR